MESREFGSSGLVASSIGFGTWPIGGTNTADGYGGVDDDEAVQALYRALDLGVTCIDTAPAYGLGRAEEILGKALGSRRQDVVLVTKCGIPYDSEKGWGRNSTYGHILQSAEESLRRLQTDYLDLLLIHWPDPDTPFEQPMRALNELRQQGKIRYAGVSNFSVAQMEECLKYGPLHANQVGYNIFDRRMEAEVLPFCAQHGIGVMAYGSLCYGLLTGAFTPETTFSGNDWRASGYAFGLPVFKGENFKLNVAMVEELKGIAQRNGRTVAQLAIAWVLRRPEVSVALVGPRRPSEIEENVQAASWQLSSADLAEIDRLYDQTLASWPEK